jgi:hypothetical protein
MKNSEIGHYWMARELSDISTQGKQVLIRTQFPTPNFTLALGGPTRSVRVGSVQLKRVNSRRDFRSGTFLLEGRTTFAAFDVSVGDTRLSMKV